MKKAELFVPDKRNLGGKKNIDQHQESHLLALINTQSTLNTRVAPHAHVNATKKSLKRVIKEAGEFQQVRETFKQIQNARTGYIDNQAPITQSRKGQITNRPCSAQDIGQQDHQRNVKSLLKRLEDVEKVSSKRIFSIKTTGSIAPNNYSVLNNSSSTSTARQRPMSALNQLGSNSTLNPHSMDMSHALSSYHNDYANIRQTAPEKQNNYLPQAMDYSDAYGMVNQEEQLVVEDEEDLFRISKDLTTKDQKYLQSKQIQGGNFSQNDSNKHNFTNNSVGKYNNSQQSKQYEDNYYDGEKMENGDGNQYYQEEGYNQNNGYEDEGGNGGEGGEEYEGEEQGGEQYQQGQYYQEGDRQLNEEDENIVKEIDEYQESYKENGQNYNQNENDIYNDDDNYIKEVQDEEQEDFQEEYEEQPQRSGRNDNQSYNQWDSKNNITKNSSFQLSSTKKNADISDYLHCERIIMEKIVQQKIFEKSEINKLSGWLKKQYPQLQISQLREITQKITINLYGEL